MKIAAKGRPAAATTREPLVVLDDLGLVTAIHAAPSSDAAWALLGDPTLATALCSARDDAARAMHARAQGVRHVTERHRAGEPVPASWLERLADLMVAELEAGWRLDDLAHDAAAARPDAVGLPPGERAVPAQEASWARIARLVAAELGLIGALGLTDDAYDRVCALDPHVALTTDDIAQHQDAARTLCREVVRVAYGQQEETT